MSDKAAGGSCGIYVNDVSALKMFGYTVGKEGWSVEKRRAFLTDFMELELPQAVRARFGGEYGDPGTAQRLRKVATVMSANCGNFLRNDRERYAVACRDWQDDLAFLREKLHEGKNLKFMPWPEPITVSRRA